jgi:two-component system response regulator (stage 0 sporulation protein F)
MTNIHYVLIKWKLEGMNKILIVDDQQGILLLLDEVFKREGFATFLASRGIEALEIAQNVKLDVILLDIKLPFMNGIEVLKRLKVTLPNVPVVMMSAYGEPAIREEAMELGASHFITKPFDIFEIRDVIKGLLKDS